MIPDPKDSVTTDYAEVVENGQVIDTAIQHSGGCYYDCDFNLDSGRFRQVEAMYEDRHYVFYHQKAVVIQLTPSTWRLASNGKQNLSEKRLINDNTPAAYRIETVDFKWQVHKDGSSVKFSEGMIIGYGEETTI